MGKIVKSGIIFCGLLLCGIIQSKAQTNTFPSDGNVGIGTTSPNSLLTVQGTINLGLRANYGGDYTTDNADYARVLAIGGVGAEAGLKIYKQNPGQSSSFLGPNNYNDSYVFEMTDANGNNPDGGIVFAGTGQDDVFEGIMYIRGNGRVGIGTNTPNEKLDVNGTVRSKEVIVENTGWADYVFEEDYPLPELEELEAYINQYKHLPGIPTQKEMQKEGQNLSEIQAKLLEKIEELTLYAIHQKKLNEELKMEMTQKVENILLQMTELKKEQEHLKQQNQHLLNQITNLKDEE